MPSPIQACARKGLVKRVALTRPAGMRNFGVRKIETNRHFRDPYRSGTVPCII